MSTNKGQSHWCNRKSVHVLQWSKQAVFTWFQIYGQHLKAHYKCWCHTLLCHDLGQLSFSPDGPPVTKDINHYDWASYTFYQRWNHMWDDDGMLFKKKKKKLNSFPYNNLQKINHLCKMSNKKPFNTVFKLYSNCKRFLMNFALRQLEWIFLVLKITVDSFG